MREPDSVSTQDRGDPSALEDALGAGASRSGRGVVVASWALLLVLVAVAVALAWRQYQDGRNRALNDAHARVVLAADLLQAYVQGEISTLNAMAQSPAVRNVQTGPMGAYFRRVQPPNGALFTGGIGWIDKNGLSRVTTSPTGPGLNVSDRPYFKIAMATGKPYVSAGLVTRRTHQEVTVLAVPTRDANGRLTGVLTGALLSKAPSTKQAAASNRSASALGFQGLAILDRDNQLLTGNLNHPQNTALLETLGRQQVGTLSNSKGLDGASGHVVAFATATLPHWTIVIDRPRSAVFAAARRGLVLELASTAAAAVLIGVLFGWILIRNRRVAEREHGRVRQWNELTRTLGSASAAKDVSDALVAALGAEFPGAHALVALEVDNRLQLVVSSPPRGTSRAIVTTDDSVLLQIAKLAYDAQKTVAIESESSLREHYPRFHGAFRGRVRAVYAAPLLVRGEHCLGSLSLLFPRARTLNETERALIVAQADRAAQALVRARMFEREHEVATQLQRSLLTEKLPEADGVGLAARYHAGAAGLEVGGDWYDAVRRPDGILHLTVGDVAGRGLAAAGLMGQLRNAFRSLAYDYTSPAEIVRRLTRHVDDDEMATTVCVTVDPYTRELAYASAGHPPVLLLDGKHVSAQLDQASAPPLGFAQPGSVREARLTLPFDATLVAYTDGLVERRGSSIDAGIALLESVVRSSPELEANPLADLVLDTIVSRLGADDDIALLVARFAEVPSLMAIEVPAHPAMLSGLRRRLTAWLALRGLDDEERADVVLAVSEACNNAVEHAYPANEGTIELVLEHRDGCLQIKVEDFGAWTPATRIDDERGRGTTIMQGLMDTAEVWHDHRGTHVTLERRLSRA
jgi:serine phosphatase RsbU (regulator of sigma subunit)/anti-sigma regulatory factor (Ser/Thr protein kinase)